MRTYEEMPAILILVCVLFIHSGITEEEIGSPLRVAQCRARCIQRFTTHGNSEKGCPQGSDCSMCWENCQLLQSNFPVWWSTICDEKRICFPGCEEACQFHAEIGGGQSEPVVRTRSEEVLKVENSVASWPRPNKASGPFVYVVMRRVGDRPWKQITQTLEPRAWVPEGGVLRVLVVNRVGLVAIYSPEQPDSEMAQMKAVLESLGRGGVLNGYPIPPPPPQGKRINTQIVQPSTSIPNNNILDDSRAEGKRPWNLHTISLIHQKYLVIAEIAWEGRRQLQGSRKPIYFVTWEVDGGGLKGNLLTESTTVTLSLCTDTVYHIEFPGCEEACQFHAEIGGGQSEPVVRTRSEEVLKVENSVASWPRPNKASGPFVYVVMRRVGDRPWKQITQTLEPRAWVPEGGVLRVLVVNRVGLVAIYSPEQPDSEMAQMKAVLESLGRGGVLNGYPIPPPPPQGKRINTQIVQPSTSIPNNNILDDSRAEGKRPWNLHTISLIHQKYLVIAEIAWEGRRQLQGSRKPIYFVTWEVDGGGLKGNLLTESTTVTLSLCTDTVYHIEVQVAVREGDAPGERSEELVVDTGLAIKVELDSGRWADAPRRVPADRRTHELALGAGAAFALFLIVALVVFIRTRRSRTPKLLPYQSQSISRVFPPMVHVVEEDNHHMPVAGLPRGTLHV